MEPHILAIDQGTSGTKTVVFDLFGRVVTRASVELASSFPYPGYVEQDPNEIYHNVIESLRQCLSRFTAEGGEVRSIACCGISNQRETFLLWDESGMPLTPAVVWQCKRSVDVCTRLRASGIGEEVRARTGLVIDPYFSGTKLIWLAENDAQLRRAFAKGTALFGTVDTWLLYRLTRGQKYSTDHTNASRTLLFNIDELVWDRRLLSEWNLASLRFPEVQPSSSLFGESVFDGALPRPIPITAMIGDSQAAAFGEGCFSSGTAKATMGTGSSILMNVGPHRFESRGGMMTTICWSMSERLDYALEGIIVTCGATIKWLRDQLGLFAESSDTEAMALSVPDNGGVDFVPAFSGLGAPWWRMDLRAAIMGLTFGTTRNHIVRAALESIPYQIADVIESMESDCGIKLSELKVDGGIAANSFVMQLLADLLGVGVVNIGIEEMSAFGAACLAGLEAGLFRGLPEIAMLPRQVRQFTASSESLTAKRAHKEWKKAVAKLL